MTGSKEKKIGGVFNIFFSDAHSERDPIPCLYGRSRGHVQTDRKLQGVLNVPRRGMRPAGARLLNSRLWTRYIGTQYLPTILLFIAPSGLYFVKYIMNTMTADKIIHFWF